MSWFTHKHFGIPPGDKRHLDVFSRVLYINILPSAEARHKIPRSSPTAATVRRFSKPTKERDFWSLVAASINSSKIGVLESPAKSENVLAETRLRPLAIFSDTLFTMKSGMSHLSNT
jgi:hypothetical protein